MSFYDIAPENVFFLDIETVPQYQSFDQLPENMQALWKRKASHIDANAQPADVYSRAGIYAEFGKIICISVGFLKMENGEYHFRVKSFYNDDEAILLTDFAKLLEMRANKPDHFLCAHNGKEFDFPYISRRMLVNRVKLPAILNTAGAKPWEVRHLDTMELWKFGDFKSYTSLALLAAIFGIPTPKDDIDGSQVAGVYYNEHNLKRIAEYCQKDTLTVAQLFLAYRILPHVRPENVTVVE